MKIMTTAMLAIALALPMAAPANAGWGSFVDSLKVFSDKEKWKKRGIYGGCVFVGNAAKGCPDQNVKENFKLDD